MSALGGLAGGIGKMGATNSANMMGQSIENSGAFAPRAGLVSAGVAPTTGIANEIPAGVSTIATAPAKFSGGQQGLSDLIEVRKLQSQQADDPLKQALAQSQINHNNAETTNIPLQQKTNQQNADNRQTADQKAEAAATAEAARQAALNADTPNKIYTDLEHMYGKDEASKWLQGATNGTLTRGRIEGGNFIPDENGPMISAQPEAKGTAVPAVDGGWFGGKKDATTTPMTAEDAKAQPMAAIQSFMDRVKASSAAGGSGRVVAPPGGAPQAGGGPPVMTPQQAAAAPKGTVFRRADNGATMTVQ